MARITPQTGREAPLLLKICIGFGRATALREGVPAHKVDALEEYTTSELQPAARVAA